MKMPTSTLTRVCTCAFALLATLALTPLASAETTLAPKAQYSADTKAALQQYDSDRKLCNDETSSTARLQCRRDAKAQYDQALTAAKARMATASDANPPPPPVQKKTPVQSAPVCAECGHVTAVSTTEKAGEGSPLGMIAGGAAGAILGHQVGQGTGKDLATIAGAVGGAYAGKKIEEKVKKHTLWSVIVEYNDGSKNSYEFDHDPGFKVGDAVKKSGNTITR
jgi:outer membrane lipoprotein SlyB